MGKTLKNKMVVLGGSMGLALASGSSYAIGPIEVAGWELDFSGNVNGFYTHTKCNQSGGVVAGGLACGSNADSNGTSTDYTNDNINTGFLPAWFGMSGKTTQNDFNIGFTIGFQPGINSNSLTDGDGNSSLDSGFGLNTSNFRQVFVTFGQDSWGEIKVGRDIGLFGKDVILNDMTLLGVGVVGDAGGGNTTFGRLGTGYMYPDWKAQITYTSPTFWGVHTQMGVFAPWGLNAFSGENADGTGVYSMSSDQFDQKSNTPRFEGRVNWDWEMPGMESDFNGSIYVTGIYQNLETDVQAYDNVRSYGYEVGGKANIYKDLDLVFHYYAGKGIGTSNYLFDAMDTAGHRRDSDGFYLQARYIVPWIGTKLGVAYGESNLDKTGWETKSNLVEENQAWTIGAYHPLTESLTLTAEFTSARSTAQNGNEGQEETIAVGAFLFY